MLPNDIILYIYEFKHNLHMIDLKEELFYGVMNHIINKFIKIVGIIYYVIINSNNNGLNEYFKFLNEYYKTHCNFIDFFCYKYRNKCKNKVTKILEALNIMNCYYTENDHFML